MSDHPTFPTGIFWLSQGRVLGVLQMRSLQEADSLGLLDCDYGHAQVWLDTLRAHGLVEELGIYEYDDIVRGRAVFSTSQEAAIVYTDLSHLDSCARGSIYDWLGLDAQTIIWRHDPHYTLSHAHRWKLIDDEADSDPPLAT